LTWYEFDPMDALQTLEIAYRASDELIKSKSMNCINMIVANYCFDAIGKKIASRLHSIEGK